MEDVITNPAFKHISAQIFLWVQVDSLLVCRRVCSSWKSFVDCFWFEKLLFVKNQVLIVAKKHVTELLKITPGYMEKQNEVDRFKLLEFRKMLGAYFECFAFKNKNDLSIAIGSFNGPNPGKLLYINYQYSSTTSQKYNYLL